MWLVALALALGSPNQESPIKHDEVVVFFPTFAHLDPKSAEWVLRFHGWICEPEMGSRVRRETMDLFVRSLGLKEQAAEAATFKRRARPFLADNERGKRIPVRLGSKTYVLDPSTPDGHFRGTVRLPAAEAQKRLKVGPGKDRWLDFRAVTRAGDERPFSGRVQLIPETGVSVISDIDDTLKVSEVWNPPALLVNTFLRDYEAVPGVATLCRTWADAGACFHYVTASPWQLYEPLADFFRQADFPAGSFHMKEFRWKDRPFHELFASPEETKRKAIEPILKAFPRRRFVLVGDSGEKDPEVYGALARKYPGQVVRVLIRDVTGQEADAERYRKAFEGLAKDRWQVFRKAEEVEAAGGGLFTSAQPPKEKP